MNFGARFILKNLKLYWRQVRSGSWTREVFVGNLKSPEARMGGRWFRPASYSEFKEYVLERLGEYRGSDIWPAIYISQERYHGSIIEARDFIFDIDFDAFQHGIYPAIIITKEGAGEELSIVKLTEEYKRAYNKSLQLKEDMLYVEQFSKSYSEYVAPNITYFSEDAKSLAIGLDVRSVIPKGLYIMGIYGGEKKKGKEEYAGIILEEYSTDGREIEFKLYNTSRPLKVPLVWLREHGIKIYKLIYMGEINPFRITYLPNILLSSHGTESLREFLRKALRTNTYRLSSKDMNKIKMLIEEVKQPSRIDALKRDGVYVVYRGKRIFVASVFKSGVDAILDSSCGAIECKNIEQAYYYAAILNYLVYKVVSMKRAFNRSQYARALLAIILTELDWNTSKLPQKYRDEIVRLSQALSKKIPVKRYSNKKDAIKDLIKYSEFMEIVGILDNSVDEKTLNDALNLVSGA